MSNDFDLNINATVEHFPNPVRTTLTINYSLGQQHTDIPVTIYNIKGELVAEIQGSNGFAHLDATTLSDGIYLYKIQNSEMTYFDKFIIIK